MFSAPVTRSHTDAQVRPRNVFDRFEWAGAFGDLGTFIPFVIAYIAVLKMEPYGILFSFGISMIVVGIVYKSPIPVQPMKAIGAVATTQAVQTALITPQAVVAGGLVTGLLWLFLGVSGLANRISRIVPRAILVGIILGLGFGLMLEGVKLMASNWWLSAGGLLLTLVLLSNRVIPAMFALLVFGAGGALVQDPTLWSALGQLRVELRAPEFALTALSWNDLFLGAVFLALPQLPLTFGNAVVAITEENNRLFPDRPVNERKMSISTGLMNLFGSGVGGVPMCHGAGGMAGHVRFGARTGGALVILGAFLLALALAFSSSIQILLRLFPMSVLGVVLFLTGAQLALGSCDLGKDKNERFATLVTAGAAVWNVGLAFVLGALVLLLFRRGWTKL